MAIFKPFTAIRPIIDKAQDVAELPYDVMNSDEAREMVNGNPYSFLHIDRAEIDFDKPIDICDKKVYEKARENLDKLVTDGICAEDSKKCLYIYTQIMNGRSQTGLVGCTAIDDYINNVIKKHEHTRADKEQDRINHVDYCNANTGPIFLTYRANNTISKTVEEWKSNHSPVYNFNKYDVQNTVWIIDCDETINTITSEFEKINSLYIADGHHRAASAVKVGQMRRMANPNYSGDEEFNYFLSVLFPSNELEIMDYNRVVKDLNGFTENEFFEKLSETMEIEKLSNVPYKPTQKHTFSMLLNGIWYKLTAKSNTFDEENPVDRLDVSILQNNVISPILGIDDPRTSDRIDFIGGIRGLDELVKRVNSDMKVAFAMYPTTLDDLMDIADAGEIMPPKSTWFEPKLMSGLFIHRLS